MSTGESTGLFSKLSSSATADLSNPTVAPTTNLGALSSYKIDSLGEDNWTAWKIRMTNILSLHKVLDHVTSPKTKLSAIDPDVLAEWETKENKA